VGYRLNIDVKGVLWSALASACLVPATLASTVLEEIVVTAQKRPEILLQTPVSIVALDAEELTARRYQDLSDLPSAVPNLQALPHPNADSTLLLFMRGVGNSDEQIIQDPSVAVYLDGVYLSRSQGLTSELLDLERIEVLRGPQGTLYGRNATSGAINLISAKPDSEEWAFTQSVTFGERSQVRSLTQINAPLTDRLAVKASYSVSQQDGFVDNAGSGVERFGDTDRSGWRIDALWNASDDVWFRLTADSAQSDDTPVFVGAVGLNPARSEAPSSGSAFVKQLQANDIEMTGVSARAEWQVNEGLSISLISARREVNDLQYQDLHSGIRGPGAVLITEAEGEQTQWTNELQLNFTNESQTLYGVAGLYWFKEESTRNARNTVPGANVRKLVFGRKIENRAKAAFAQVSWVPEWSGKAWELSLGVRASEDERHVLLDRAQQSPLDGPLMFNPNSSVGDRDFDNVSPAFIARYTLSDSANAYFKRVYGYKSGGFNARASSPVRFSEGFDDETMVSNELGYKGEYWGRRVRVGLAYFQSEYEDIQMNVQSDPANIVVADVLNAGKASIDGIELDVEWLLSDADLLTIRYGWLDASYDVIRNAAGANVAGDYRFMGAPDHTVALGLSGDLSLGRVFDVQYRLDYSWRSDFFGSNTTDAGVYRIPSYGLLNGSLSREFDVARGSLRATFWGSNLMDTDYLLYHFNAGAGGPIPSAVWGEPRTLGLTLRLDL